MSLKKNSCILICQNVSLKNFFSLFEWYCWRRELKIDPSKVDVILNWPRPKTITEVRSFLGATQYWRKFIANFSSIANPLNSLTSVKRVFSEKENNKRPLMHWRKRPIQLQYFHFHTWDSHSRFRLMLVIMPWVQSSCNMVSLSIFIWKLSMVHVTQ